MKKITSLILLSLLPITIYGCPTAGVSPDMSGASSGAYSSPNTSMGSPQAQSDSYQYQPNSEALKSKESVNTEEYNKIYDNSFLDPIKNPLSTFSVDVDTASYSNIRRYIESGQVPPKDSARIEEMINYFTYDYPQPTGTDPFSINMEMSQAPWNKEHKLVQIGLQGKTIDKKDIPASNLVFLIDTSGSMADSLVNLKESFKLLVSQLRESDRISIVTYAGSSEVVLDSAYGTEKNKINQAIDRMQSGGSTAGAAGIATAYEIAKKNFIADGNNRVILATDGDFNVGISSEAELVKMIEEKRNQGTFLSVLGFGMGNYQDSKMEQLADKGNGNYSYIDSLKEAKKVFVDGMAGTLLPIAKDVKLQIEFNPAKVKSYRLIGYENRLLNKEDFNNDKKDAGDMGAGSSVTAFYEIIPAENTSVDKLKYQENVVKSEDFMTNEIINVKFRYKDPKGTESKLITKALEENNLEIENTSDNFRFAASVAGFGMILRDSEYKGDITLSKVTDMANKSKGFDAEGYRRDFIKLLDKYGSIKK